MSTSSYDVVIIGGGHAGAEAASVSARLGCNTLLVTHKIETLGVLSCNPAIGGIGKGHLVREITALGGLMGPVADRAAIQARVLNRRKGPAVQATRVQADRRTYAEEIRRALETSPLITLFQDRVTEILYNQGTCRGVQTQSGAKIEADGVVVTAGTFLGGSIHVGKSSCPAGRSGDPEASALAIHLRELGLGAGRLKTGTPPRLDRRTVNIEALEPQYGEDPRPIFSPFSERLEPLPETPCYLTWTTPKAHEEIRAALDQSPIYDGAIQSAGPRYCPSIEDKVVRFSDRDHHQVFLEPEGLHAYELYPNGVSTSLPFPVQQRMIRSITGLERAEITRPGYAIEYDFFDPRDLERSLEVSSIPGLYLAGQVNGTTGYEEAAAQGLIAGLNAARKACDLEPWSPSRDQAYIGVLIDDLVTKGVREPYRMFTSRAEHRLWLRADNAEERLMETGYSVGAVPDATWERWARYHEKLQGERMYFQKTLVKPGDLNCAQEERLGRPLRREQTLYELLRRPEIDYNDACFIGGVPHQEPAQGIGRQLEIEARYEGYVEREARENARHHRYAGVEIPQALSYQDIEGLSVEVQERLRKVQPATIGEAARLPGVTPAAISLLLVHLRRKGWLRPARQDNDAV